MVLTQWFYLGLSVIVVKKLLSISPFVAKVPFVPLYLIIFNSLCIITIKTSVFRNSTLYILFYLYVGFVLPFFWVHFHQKKEEDIIQENKVLSRGNMTSGCYPQLQYTQFLNKCLNKTFMHGKHVAHHENCPLQLLFMYELCSLYSMENWFIDNVLYMLLA